MTNLITPHALFSPVFLQSCSVIHDSGSDNSFQRYGHSKFSNMAGGRILDLVQPEVGPFDPPSPKPYPGIIKHEVDRTTRSRDMAVRSFPKCEVGGSVGRSSVLNISLLALITRPPDGVLLAPFGARCSAPAAPRLVTRAITHRPDGVS